MCMFRLGVVGLCWYVLLVPICLLVRYVLLRQPFGCFQSQVFFSSPQQVVHSPGQPVHFPMVQCPSQFLIFSFSSHSNVLKPEGIRAQVSLHSVSIFQRGISWKLIGFDPLWLLDEVVMFKLFCPFKEAPLSWKLIGRSPMITWWEFHSLKKNCATILIWHSM